LTAANDDRKDNGNDPDAAEAVEGEEDEFAFNDEEVASADLDSFDDDVELDEGEETDVDPVVELSAKEQDARSLEIRRKIEKRREERELQEDIDYLDFDLDE